MRPVAVAIPTRNRPDLLKRAIEAVCDDVHHADRRVEILVVDQSIGDCALANRRFLARLTLEREVRVSYLGWEQRRALTGAMPTGNFLDFSSCVPSTMLGSAYGENRNWISLYHAGDAYVSIDDDVIAKPFRSKRRPGFDVPEENFGFPWSFLSYRSREDMFADMDEQDGSLLLKLFEGTTAFEGNSGPGYVACGVAGHSGLWSHALLTDVDCPLSRLELLCSDASFQEAMDSTSVVRQALACRRSDAGAFMTTIFASSNHLAGIPFLPAGRGEDYMMGWMSYKLGYCPEVINLPLSALHFPEGDRSSCATIDVASFSSLVAASVTAIGASRTSDLCDGMLDVASGAHWDDFIRHALVTHALAQQAYCERLGEAPDLARMPFRSIVARASAWQRLADALSSGRIDQELGERLTSVRQLMIGFSRLMANWQQTWAWSQANRAAFETVCRIS